MPLSDSRVRDNELLQESVGDECGRKAIDCCREILKRWDDRFTFQRPAFAERYERGDLNVHVHVRVHPGDVDLCAVFKQQGESRCRSSLVLPSVEEVRLSERHSDSPHDAGAGRGDSPSRCGFPLENEAPRIAGNEAKRLMLVGVVELPNSPKRIADLVRVETVEEFYGSISAGQFFSPWFGYKRLGLHPSGELVVPVPGASRGALPQMVEADMEVMHRVGDDGGEVYRHALALAEGVHPSVEEAVLVLLILRIESSGIGASVLPPFDRRFQITDVLVGPVDLDPSAGRPIAQSGQ